MISHISFQILIGPSDWEDHLLNKDGAEKYRTQNLPNCSSCPGLYELGIAVSCPQTGREFDKLKSNFIIPVYLGQANNVRTRLQRYGREGAHLENGFPNSELSDSRGQGLFTEIFSRGFPIVYRWAPVSISISFPFVITWTNERDFQSCYVFFLLQLIYTIC